MATVDAIEVADDEDGAGQFGGTPARVKDGDMVLPAVATRAGIEDKKARARLKAEARPVKPQGRLPYEVGDEGPRAKTGDVEERGDPVFIRLLACTEFRRVDATADEQHVDPLPDRAAHVGPDPVADRKDIGGSEVSAVERGQPRQRRAVDRRVRLADHDDLAAKSGVTLAKAPAHRGAGRRARRRCRD